MLVLRNVVDNVINPYRPNFELSSTALYQDQSGTKNDTLLQCFMLVCPKYSRCFEFGRFEIFWKNNLDQTVGINKSNFERKQLRASFVARSYTCIHPPFFQERISLANNCNDYSERYYDSYVQLSAICYCTSFLLT